MKLASHRRTRIILGFLAIFVAVGVLVVPLGRISRDGRREVLTWSKSHSLAGQPTASSSSQRQDNPASGLSSPISCTANASPALLIPDGAPTRLIFSVQKANLEQAH